MYDFRVFAAMTAWDTNCICGSLCPFTLHLQQHNRIYNAPDITSTPLIYSPMLQRKVIPDLSSDHYPIFINIALHSLIPTQTHLQITFHYIKHFIVARKICDKQGTIITK